MHDSYPSAPLASQRNIRERVLWSALAFLFAMSLALAMIHFGQTKIEPQVIHAYIPPPEKCYAERVGLLGLKVEPALDSLHSRSAFR